MATIGSFKKVGNDFQGEIVTLSLQARGVRIGTLKEGSSSLSKKSFGFPRMLAHSSRGSGPTCTRADSCDPSG